MTDNNIIHQARALTGKGLKRLDPRDKLLIGRALLVGKKEAKDNKRAYRDWREANGFIGLTRTDREDCEWLAENAHWAWFLGYAGFPGYADPTSIQKARLAWEAEQDDKNTR